jgi:hypothetical protein
MKKLFIALYIFALQALGAELAEPVEGTVCNNLNLCVSFEDAELLIQVHYLLERGEQDDNVPDIKQWLIKVAETPHRFNKLLIYRFDDRGTIIEEAFKRDYSLFLFLLDVSLRMTGEPLPVLTKSINNQSLLRNIIDIVIKTYDDNPDINYSSLLQRVFNEVLFKTDVEKDLRETLTELQAVAHKDSSDALKYFSNEISWKLGLITGKISSTALEAVSRKRPREENLNHPEEPESKSKRSKVITQENCLSCKKVMPPKRTEFCNACSLRKWRNLPACEKCDFIKYAVDIEIPCKEEGCNNHVHLNNQYGHAKEKSAACLSCESVKGKKSL